MQQNELAKVLGISPAMVSRLKKQGMPTDDPARAQRWRKRHLEPGRIKGSRFDPNQKAQSTAPPPVAAALAGELQAEIEAAGVELDKVLTAGDLEWAAVMVQQVRDLLRKIPGDAMPRFSLRAWLALVDWFIHPACGILHTPDKAALLTPVEFGMRWHGWPNYPLLNEHTLDAACDWRDISIHGWPAYPDDDKWDAEAMKANEAPA
jgi:hypothetical protein